MRFVGIDMRRTSMWWPSWMRAAGCQADRVHRGRDGYPALFTRLGPPADTLVAMEATGHYWKNLFATLVARGFAVALLNPLRTHRFAGEDLQRTKTDAIDAVGIARFAAQKRPPVTRLPDAAIEELRELVRLRDRLIQDFGDRVRQLHRLVDLGFPEFPRHVRTRGASWPRRCCASIPRPRRSAGCPRGAWRGCATTAAIAWATPWPPSCSMRPPGRWVSITARSTGSRSATPARIWTCCAVGCARSSGTSSGCWRP